MVDVVGTIPEFTDDTQVASTGMEVISSGDIKPDAQEAPVEEKVTPAEPPAVEKPVEKDVDTGKQIQGLEQEKSKLLKEISVLRGTKRELKQEELMVAQKKLDDLKDVNPADVDVIERVIRSRGYVTEAEMNRTFYEAVKQEELNKFLEKYPEYKLENDPNDLNWGSLQRELAYYRAPTDPHKTLDVLERAHRGIAKVSSDRGVEAKKAQVKIASTGGGGAQRSSLKKSFTSEQRLAFEMGGWSEKEIEEMEKNLPEK